MNAVCHKTAKRAMTVAAVEIVCPFSEMKDRIAIAFTRILSKGESLGKSPRSERVIGFYPQEGGTGPEECYYYVGLEIDPCAELPEGLVKMEIPAREYVAYHYLGPLARHMEEAYGIVNGWIDENGLRHDRGACVLELIGRDSDLSESTNGLIDLELCMPVK